MSKKHDGTTTILLFALGFLIGGVSIYLYLNWAKPTGWILAAKGSDTSYLQYSEIKLIRDLLKNGNLFTQTDLLENFVAYYHTLISILITLILFLAGFVTFNFFRSRKEYNGKR